ncbi:MAG: hypothetical protein ABSE48_07325 [Verrucomicrobiota bacterium]|jgi:hypothetical protein
MRKYTMALATLGAGLMLALNLSAQTAAVNPPATELENFELQTNTTIVKGTSLVGTVALDNNCTFVVHAREANDIDHSQKAYGITIALSGSLPQGAPDKLSLVVDYDELDSLTAAADYIGKVTWGVTQLNSFEAGYVTKSGFHFIAHSDRRQDVINTYVEFGDLPRIQVNSDQLAQLRSLLAQAKSMLDSLK